MSDFLLIKQLRYLKESPQKNKNLLPDKLLDQVKIKGNLIGTASDLSIIIVAFREKLEELERCLDSLRPLMQGLGCELIFVDNGLDEDCARVVCEVSDLYVKPPENLGCCGGRNLGAYFATAPSMMFVDADGSILNADIEAIKQFNLSDLIAARGKVCSASSGSDPLHYDLGDDERPSLIDTEGISIWKRSYFVDAGGFNEDLKGNEGIVLGYRLVNYFSADPRQFIYLPVLVLTHDFQSEERFASAPKKKYYYVQYMYLRERYSGIDRFLREGLKARSQKRKRESGVFGLFLYRLSRLWLDIQFRLIKCCF